MGIVGNVAGSPSERDNTVKTSNHHHRYGAGLSLCVKQYNITRDVPAHAPGSDAQQERAWNETARAWWQEAETLAKSHGFKSVYSAGRCGGWLYTDPLPEPEKDDAGEETGKPGEYPPAFVSDLSALLDRAPAMYAETLADIIADDADEAEREAMPARLALALANVSGKPAGDPCCCLDAGTHECEHCEARAVLNDYRGMLIDADCQRDLTEDEAEALRVLSGGDA